LNIVEKYIEKEKYFIKSLFEKIINEYKQKIEKKLEIKNLNILKNYILS